MFTASSKPNWRVIKDHLAAEGRIAKSDLLLLVGQATSTFRRERNLLELKDPVTVVGDIHGQFYDFIKMLDIGGNPENTKYLFLGDFVDRGNFSIEVIALLFSIKINFPSTVFMIRGNHECR
jgi:serine/threonine-protein phosphatase 2B catalytic subunit